ncbi:MAG TPA: hypothetical protein VNC84_06505 [Gammaproteobacteria bacterium]|nr:hypothetical protein [Gammaproteobacteria bacterium]
MHNITTMEAANEYLTNIYMPAFNDEFKVLAVTEGSAFVPWLNGNNGVRLVTGSGLRNCTFHS